MKKKILILILLVIVISLPLAACSLDTSNNNSDYTAYLFFNGQYIRYDNIKSYNVSESGKVDLKMKDNREIELYSPGNITIVTEKAIPEFKQDNKDNSKDKK